MEKGFRTVQCSGCPVKLRIPISEKDYGETKKIRCPKCGTIGRVKIPHPASEASPTKRPQPSSDVNSFPGGFFDLFGGPLNGGPKK